MKRYILLLHLLYAVFITGCATNPATTVFTMQTDAYPLGITRAEYYEQMAVAYSLENQTEKAIENFRLSILHSPQRISSYLALSDEYRKKKTKIIWHWWN